RTVSAIRRFSFVRAFRLSSYTTIIPGKGESHEACEAVQRPDTTYTTRLPPGRGDQRVRPDPATSTSRGGPVQGEWTQRTGRLLYPDFPEWRPEPPGYVGHEARRPGGGPRRIPPRGDLSAGDSPV